MPVYFEQGELILEHGMRLPATVVLDGRTAKGTIYDGQIILVANELENNDGKWALKPTGQLIIRDRNELIANLGKDYERKPDPYGLRNRGKEVRSFADRIESYKTLEDLRRALSLSNPSTLTTRQTLALGRKWFAWMRSDTLIDVASRLVLATIFETHRLVPAVYNFKASEEFANDHDDHPDQVAANVTAFSWLWASLTMVSCVVFVVSTIFLRNSTAEIPTIMDSLIMTGAYFVTIALAPYKAHFFLNAYRLIEKALAYRATVKKNSSGFSKDELRLMLSMVYLMEADKRVSEIVHSKARPTVDDWKDIFVRYLLYRNKENMSAFQAQRKKIIRYFPNWKNMSSTVDKKLVLIQDIKNLSLAGNKLESWGYSRYEAQLVYFLQLRLEKAGNAFEQVFSPTFQAQQSLLQTFEKKWRSEPQSYGKVLADIQVGLQLNAPGLYYILFSSPDSAWQWVQKHVSDHMILQDRIDKMLEKNRANNESPKFIEPKGLREWINELPLVTDHANHFIDVRSEVAKIIRAVSGNSGGGMNNHYDWATMNEKLTDDELRDYLNLILNQQDAVKQVGRLIEKYSARRMLSPDVAKVLSDNEDADRPMSIVALNNTLMVKMFMDFPGGVKNYNTPESRERLQLALKLLNEKIQQLQDDQETKQRSAKNFEQAGSIIQEIRSAAEAFRQHRENNRC